MNEHAYQQGRRDALTAFKLAEWNWELTGRPQKKDVISTDNGRRTYGTRFEDSGRPSRIVSQAFNSLNSTRPSDLINDAGQAFVGSAGAGAGFDA